MKKHIKIVAGVLALTFAFSGGMAVERENISITSPITANAGTYRAFSYAVEYGEITITGFDKSVRDVVIPSEIEGLPVAKIGSYAFYECSDITSVTIPDNVTNIGERGFAGCSSLTSVTIPDSVTSIGDGAFADCSSLASVTIPDSITNIGKSTFWGCSSLTSITIPASVTRVGMGAFSDCSNLTSITLPDSVTSIGEWAFMRCSSLTSVTIPNSVTSIESGAFSDCSSLKSVTIPKSVTEIRDSVFSGCSNLTGITILNPECEIYDNQSTISNRNDYENNESYFNGKIYSYENSTAQAYAEKYDYRFVPIKSISVKPTIKKGDINEDGLIDVVDASIILSYYSYTSTTTDSPVMTLDEYMDSMADNK